MVCGSQNHKSQTTYNQGTPQTPMKPPTLNNVPALTSTSSDSQTSDYNKLIEEQQKVITSI